MYNLLLEYTGISWNMISNNCSNIKTMYKLDGPVADYTCYTAVRRSVAQVKLHGGVTSTCIIPNTIIQCSVAVWQSHGRTSTMHTVCINELLYIRGVTFLFIISIRPFAV